MHASVVTPAKGGSLLYEKPTLYNNYEYTITQQLADADAWCQAYTACAFTRWHHFSVWNDVVSTTL